MATNIKTLYDKVGDQVAPRTIISAITDMPTITGNAGKVLAVNTGATALEFIQVSVGTYDNTTALTGANVYDEITVADGIVTGLTSRELTFTDIGAADATHAHGSITTDGKIGTTAGLMVKTTTAGALSALAAGTTSQFLRGDGTWQTPPSATNLTSILLTLGNYTIGFNSGTDKLEIKYIG